MIQIPDEKTAQAVTHNVVGYALIGLTASVITLFYLFINMNTYVRDDLLKGNLQLQKAITKNNQVLVDLKILFITNTDLKNEAARMRGEIRANEFMDSLEEKSN